MINEQLSAYIRECIDKGIANQSIIDTLVASGWNREEVINAVTIMTQGSTPAITIPPPINSTESKTSEFALPTSPVVNSVPQLQVATEVANQSASQQQSFTKEEIFNEPKAARKTGVIIAVVLFFVAALGASGYFFLAPKTPTPMQELSLMRTAMKDVKSYVFDMKFGIDIKVIPGKELSETAGSLLGKGSEGALKLGITSKGSTVIGESATSTALDLSYNLDGTANYGAMSVVLDGGADFRSVNQMFYVRITKIPQLLAMVGMDKTLDPWVNKWLSADLHSTSSLSEMVNKNLQATTSFSAADKEKLNLILEKDWPLVIVVPEDKTQLIGAVDTYHYKFIIDKEKFALLLTDIFEAYPSGNTAMQNPEELKYSIELASQLFGSSTGDMYIGIKTPYLYRFNMNIPVNISTTSVAVNGAMTIDIDESQFNAVPAIVPPDESTPITEAYKQITGKEIGQTEPLEINTESPDTIRIRDMGQLQLALARYQDAHQSYPLTLAQLVNDEVNGVAIVPPNLSKSILMNEAVYYPLNSVNKLKHTGVLCTKQPCKTYILGVSLDEKDLNTLATDADILSIVNLASKAKNQMLIKGADTTGCLGEKGKFCYDLVP